MKLFGKIALIVLSLLSSVTMVAQEVTTTKLMELLVEKEIITSQEAEALIEEIDEEKPTKANPIENAQKFVRNAFTNTPWLTVGGYGLMMYQYNDAQPITNNFRPRLVMISVGGKITETLKYNILADVIAPCLYEYNVMWSPHTAFNLKVGQMKTPFSLENQISLTALETVLNSRSVSALSGMAGDVLGSHNGAGRDIGIQFSGAFVQMKEHQLIDYSIGVFQGAGINIGDNNKKKDLAGMLAIQPIKGLRIAASGYYGTAHYVIGTAPAENHTRNRVAVGAEYKHERVYARAEYLFGDDAGVNKQGGYVTGLYYFIPKKLNAFARVDYFNYNTKAVSSTTDYTAGVNYYFAPLCRLQLNYTFSDNSKRTGAIANTNSVEAQLQIVF